MKRYIFVIAIILLLTSFSYADTDNISKAKAEIKAGNFKKAQTLLYDTLLPAPDSTLMPETYFLLAKCSPTLSKANYFYKSIIQMQNNKFSKLAKLYYAKNLTCQENYQEAKSYLKEIIALPPSSCTAEANFNYAQICYQENNYDEAIAYYINYRNKGKNTAKKVTSLLNIGNSYYNLGDYETARKNFEKLLHYDLGDKIVSYTFFKIAQTYEKEKEYKKASEFYQKIVDQHPYSPEYEMAENRIIELAENGMSIETPTQDTTSTKKVDKFYVQLSAYKDKENARKMRTKYAEKDIHTVLYDKMVDNQKFFCLGIGPYFSKQEALLKKRELQRQDISSFIYKKSYEQDKE